MPPEGLDRFVVAQDTMYDTALTELRAGAKRSHWMWFIFPQLAGLGRSDTARFFGIAGLDDARAYLAHVLLGPRLVECTQALLDWAGRRDAPDILGAVDALKLRSSMTLFEAAGGDPCFGATLDAFYAGDRDDLTLAMLQRN